MVQGRAAGLNFGLRVKELKGQLVEFKKAVLKEVVADIADSSPVLSGRYVGAHNVEEARSAARQFAGPYLANVPNSPDPTADREAAKSRMIGQVNGLSDDFTYASVNNRIPHAVNVEYSGWGGKPAYAVYATAFSRRAAHIAAAKAKVGLT